MTNMMRYDSSEAALISVDSPLNRSSSTSPLGKMETATTVICVVSKNSGRV